MKGCFSWFGDSDMIVQGVEPCWFGYSVAREASLSDISPFLASAST